MSIVSYNVCDREGCENKAYGEVGVSHFTTDICVEHIEQLFTAALDILGDSRVTFLRDNKMQLHENQS